MCHCQYFTSCNTSPKKLNIADFMQSPSAAYPMVHSSSPDLTGNNHGSSSFQLFLWKFFSDGGLIQKKGKISNEIIISSPSPFISHSSSRTVTETDNLKNHRRRTMPPTIMPPTSHEETVAFRPTESVSFHRRMSLQIRSVSGCCLSLFGECSPVACFYFSPIQLLTHFFLSSRTGRQILPSRHHLRCW